MRVCNCAKMIDVAENNWRLHLAVVASLGNCSYSERQSKMTKLQFHQSLQPTTCMHVHCVCVQCACVQCACVYHVSTVHVSSVHASSMHAHVTRCEDSDKEGWVFSGYITQWGGNSGDVCSSQLMTIHTSLILMSSCVPVSITYL